MLKNICCSILFIQYYCLRKKSLWKSFEEMLFGQVFVGTSCNFHIRFPPRFLSEGYKLSRRNEIDQTELGIVALLALLGFRLTRVALEMQLTYLILFEVEVIHLFVE